MLSKRKEAPTMGQLWSFVEHKQNREIPVRISSGLAVALAGIWTALVHFSTPPQTPDSSPSVEARCGSVGIGGAVSRATITAGNTGSCPERKP